MKFVEGRPLLRRRRFSSRMFRVPDWKRSGPASQFPLRVVEKLDGRRFTFLHAQLERAVSAAPRYTLLNSTLGGWRRRTRDWRATRPSRSQGGPHETDPRWT